MKKSQGELMEYRVIYTGNNSRYKDLNVFYNARSEREAVEKFYAEYFDDNYFPQEDGSIQDSSGWEIANSVNSQIEFDGGFFIAHKV